jgi:hypothetical protein
MTATLTTPSRTEILGENVKNANCAGLPRGAFQDLLLLEVPDVMAVGICEGCKMFRRLNACPERLEATPQVIFTRRQKKG